MHPSPITDTCDNFAAPPYMKHTGFGNADQYQLIAGLIPDEPNMKAEYNQGKSFTSVYLLFYLFILTPSVSHPSSSFSFI